VGFLLAMFVVVVAGQPSIAWAVDDSVDSWDVSYTVGNDGVVHVAETLVYRFGTNSGRHGIDRYLVTREAWGKTDNDAVYEYTNITVTSPDASPAYSISKQGSGRDQLMRIRIGSPYLTVPGPTATYTLVYDITGAMRTSGSYDEFYWDVISDMTPYVSNITVSVKVPGGVMDVRCYSGMVKTDNPCTSAAVGADGVASFKQAQKAPGDIMTVAAMIGPELISDNQPHLVTRADMQQVMEARIAWGSAGVSAVVAALIVVLAVRGKRRDQCFLDVAPGTIDEPDGRVGSARGRVIPVRFQPPGIPVALGGLLDDGRVDVRDTTAALLSLSARGVLKLRQAAEAPKDYVYGGVCDRPVYATLITEDVPMAPHEIALVREIFGRMAPGQEKVLSGGATLYLAHRNLVSKLWQVALDSKWYVRLPSEHEMQTNPDSEFAPATRFGAAVGLVAILVACVVVPLVQVFSWTAFIGPVVFAVIGAVVYQSLLNKGQRSAVGRAYTDQVVGFRDYIATAEADQIKFEEGQDIFTEYLPWAVIFGLTDRWTRICSELVKLGRLPSIEPSWYSGETSTYDFFTLTRILNDRSMRPEQVVVPAVQQTPSSPSTSSSGSSSWFFNSSGSGFGGGSSFGGGGSFGGGSSFGGGGFSGGGGGGGGVSSW